MRDPTAAQVSNAEVTNTHTSLCGLHYTPVKSCSRTQQQHNQVLVSTAGIHNYGQCSHRSQNTTEQQPRGKPRVCKGTHE